MKQCSKCNQWKKETEFYFRKDLNKYRNECKSCYSKQQKIYKKNNTKKVRQSGKEYYIKNKKIISIKTREYRKRPDVKKRRNRMNIEYHKRLKATPGKNRIKCFCKHCGKIFFTTSSILKHGRGIYCSVDCQRKGTRTTPERVCLYCGKTFRNTRKHGGKKFCNIKCYFKARRKFECYRGENHPFYNRVEVVCHYCKKVFSVQPCVLKNNHGKYCSKKCANKAFKEFDRYKGENHGHWKGGKFPYYGIGWKKANKDALIYAGFKSELSGHDGELDVHHVFPRKVFVDKFIDLCLKPYIDGIKRKHFCILPYELIPKLLFDEMNMSRNLFVLTHSEHHRFEGMPVTFFDAIKYQNILSSQ